MSRSRREPHDGDISVEELYDALAVALDDYAPGWEEEIDLEEVWEWVEERWPLPRTVLLDLEPWARSCYGELSMAHPRVPG